MNGALWARNSSAGRIPTSVEGVSLFLNAFNFHKAIYSMMASRLDSKSTGLHVNPCRRFIPSEQHSDMLT